jgi:hypothetical protein
MTRLLLAGAIICLGALVFRSQHHRHDLIEKQNVRLATMADVLKRRSEENARAQASAEEKLRPLQDELAARQSARSQPPHEAAPSPRPVPPDATHQGGWPQNADYFYLPKTFLQQASFQVLNQQQLSDEAVSLFNLTEPEREDVNRAIGDLFAQLRSAESERMQLVNLPEEWTNSGDFASGVAYHIPSFANDVAAWRQGLQQRLETILGAERSALLSSGLENHLREDWNDLGESERTVGFVWRPESNGTQSLWSATKDRRCGDGTFRRYLPGGPDEPTFRHYANLFGIELPTH